MTGRTRLFKFPGTLRPRALAAGLCLSAIFLILAAGSAAGAGPYRWQAMGSVPCSWSVPIQTANHALDVATTISRLRAHGFHCYVQPIEEKAPYRYSDFKRLLPAAQSGGISVWAVLIPKHEGSSRPYGLDFVRWMRELAKLSLQYPALRGVNIDDTDVGGEQDVFTHAYFCRIDAVKKKINPNLFFVPTIYGLEPAEANRLAGCVDGVWLWWTNLEQNNGLRAFLIDSRLVARGRFPVYSGVYAHSTSWHRQGGPRTKVFKKALTLACRESDGAIIWQLPLTEGSNPWLDVAREFTAGGSSELAGKCGNPAGREDSRR